eukprot:361536-Chlamydomonas_euryale.AAC.3
MDACTHAQASAILSSGVRIHAPSATCVPPSVQVKNSLGVPAQMLVVQPDGSLALSEVPAGDSPTLLITPLQQPAPGLLSGGVGGVGGDVLGKRLPAGRIGRSGGATRGGADGEQGYGGGSGDGVPPLLWMLVDVLDFVAPATPPAGGGGDGGDSGGNGGDVGDVGDGSGEGDGADDGDAVQCSVRVAGRLAGLMPESAWGMTTRALRLPCHRGATAGAADGGAGSGAWRERFVVRLPRDLCQDLIKRTADEQFEGTPLE